jgi:hypothetical protein
MLRFDANPDSIRILLPQTVKLRAMQEFALGGGTSLALCEGLKLDGTTVIGQATHTLTLDANGMKLD